jgi:hypothetical protein
MDVCVCLSGADGRVVEGRINTLSATTARSARVRVPSGRVPMGVQMLLCMSVNVRWNGRGWPGKVPRSPVASPIGKGTRKMNWKNGRPKGTVKAVWQKTGMAT